MNFLKAYFMKLNNVFEDDDDNDKVFELLNYTNTEQ
jgi:hypothetical protein